MSIECGVCSTIYIVDNLYEIHFLVFGPLYKQSGNRAYLLFK